MNSKLIGGILLVVGTTIGAGMLALPIATAQLGFWGSLVLLFSCWGVMTTCTFLFLEVNLWLPPNSNLISMAGATLGKGGQAVAWMVYMFLLYSILSAYIAGGGDLFHYLLATSGITIPLSAASIIFTCLFGLVVYFGIRSVDYVNRGLMFGKMSALIVLIILIIPFVSGANLMGGEIKHIINPTSLTVTTASFGCIMIVPSLRTYFGDDVKTLRKAIFIGTLIPLICYIGWDMVIMGVIPLNGTSSLNQILHSSTANSDMIAALSSILQKDMVTLLAKFFTSICMATSFLSVSLSLSDFLSDGLNVKKQGVSGNALVFGTTFLPPLLIVLFYPYAFLRGIEYAGICCFILMILLPALMAWRGRYLRKMTNVNYQFPMTNVNYKFPGGKVLLALLVVFSLVMLVTSGLEGKIALILLISTFMVGFGFGKAK
jgi:tyrosine-specific transport protein